MPDERYLVNTILVENGRLEEALNKNQKPGYRLVSEYGFDLPVMVDVTDAKFLSSYECIWENIDAR